MILYHGTTKRALNKIKAEGITPRALRGDTGNWSGSALSREDFVYLSSAYPAFYAQNALGESDTALAIVEVETLGLTLYPDEDFVSASFRHHGQDVSPKNIDPADYQQHWASSLKANGVVATRAVAPEHIRRHVLVPRKNIPLLLAVGGDSSPTVINFAAKGEEYIAAIETLFERGPDAVIELVEEQNRRWLGALDEAA